ncbi:unnamed protein product [Rotaria magnacalcarata]|uniref:Replication protein A OB domain-containing protein n=1 Tax=Rotaria magnacalcarata TaxID=392030 RepID=A0A815HA79_9BILA|nr:unnamed protein product [Rotaria magnacalcarata]CAF1349438.1 unnamed protein product [Rotaria magnacalcarata]
MAFMFRNIDNASQLKVWSGVMFAPRVENYINILADIHSIHPDSLAIVLINFAAATLEFSYVLRANSISNKIPTNLFNMIVARSSYGKSDLTRLLRDMLQTVVLHRPTKFCSTSQVAVGIQANPSLDEMSKAGLMSGLDECCRIMICDEADITFSDVGLFLSHNGCRASPEMNCRALVMTLFDRVSHAYIRQLANRSVSVKYSKLNIMGCSTGDLISNMIIRMKSGACFDPAIGRFIFWPLDGPVIPDKLVHRQIDNHLFPSLHQFGIILSFIENVVFSFEDDGINEMILWGNKCKQRSFDERNTNESLSARLGKSVQHVYRMATFLQTIEIGFSISQEYIERYQQFPAIGVIDTDFIDNVSDLLFSKYPAQFRLHEPDPFQISKDIALRAIDLISCNIRQFIMLFDSTYAPKVPSIGRQVVIISSNEQKRFSGDQSLIQNKELNLKQHQRSMSNLNNVAAAVILFPSLCFTMKQLHRSTIIHNNSGGGVLKQVMKKLVDTDVLAICPRGVKHASRTTCVYIKKLPLENDVDGEKEFLSILSEYTYKEKPISIDMYRQSCKSIVLEAIGTVQEEVFQLLGRPEYGTRDLNMLVNLPKTNKSNIDCSNNHTLIQTIENSALHQDDERENIVAMSSSYSNQSSLCSSDILLQEEENLFDNLNFIDQPQNENVDCISVHHEEKHNSFNTIDFPNAEENINLNSINIFQEKHLNDLNNVDFLDVQEPINFNNADMFPEEQHDDLHSMDCPDTGEIVDLINISISPEEQRNDINSNDFLDGEANINLNNIDIVPEKQCSHLNNGNAAHSENNSNLNNVNIYHNDQSNCSDNFFSSPAAERTRYVLQIVQMQLVSQEKECIGEPEPYLWQSTHASASITKRNLLDNSTVPSSVLGQLPAALEVIPVAQISVLVSKNVAIEGRVICKSELCRFANGKGKFFTFDVADSSSEIRCKVFNDITDMFVELIVVGQAYHLTNFTINRSNKQYNHLPHDFEINLKKNSVIYQISGDAFKNVNISFNVVKISSISLSDVGRSVDLSVTIKSIGDVENLYVQKNNSYSNRRIVMVSDDSADINIVFWGNLAKNFSAQVHQTILVRDLLVQCFHGQLQFATTMMTLITLQ